MAPQVSYQAAEKPFRHSSASMACTSACDELSRAGQEENAPQDAQKGHPLRTSFVKRRSSLVIEPAAACSRDTLHDSRFTGVENAAWEKARLGAPGSGG